MRTKTTICSMCNSGYDEVECHGIIVMHNTPPSDYRYIWLCDTCFDEFPTELCVVKRKTDMQTEPEIFIDMTKFPNLDTYMIFLECVIGSGSFRSRSGNKLKYHMNGITTPLHAKRQMQIFITNDWRMTELDPSKSVANGTGIHTNIRMDNVDYDFLTSLYWRGNKWGYAPNQLRVVFFHYTNSDVYYVIVSTDDAKTDQLLRDETKDTQVCMIFDEIFTFENVDEAVKNMMKMYMYVRSHDEFSTRWMYFVQHVSCRHYDAYDDEHIGRMLYIGERLH